MLEKCFISLTMLLLLTACLEVNNLEKDTSSDLMTKKETLAIKQLGIDEEIKTIGEPIDLDKLKKLTFLTTTSGVLSDSESMRFCKPFDHRFFGQYQLNDRIDDKNGILGQLVVSVSKKAKNWLYDSKFENFIEITLQSNKIKIWEKIGVGSSETQLKNFIGNRFSYKKGTTISAELGEYTLNTTILGDTINKLKVGKYCR